MPHFTLRPPRCSSLALALTTGVLMLAGGCTDSPMEPEPLAPPVGDLLSAVFLSPVDREAFSATAAPMGASTNSGLDLGGTGWQPLDAGVPEPMYVYFRTWGSISYSINPNVVPGFCDILCVFKTAPYVPGEAGGAGIPGTGWLRYRVRVNGAELIGNALPDGQMEFLAFVNPGDSIFVQRTGVDGVVTCLTRLICAGYREGWYTLTNLGSQVESYKVHPLQVQPETNVAAPGDSVTFRVTTFDDNVSRWSWLWRHANGAGGPGFSECTGKPMCRVPVTDGGYMVVHDARWRITQPLRQAISAPVRVQQVSVSLRCNGQEDSVIVTRAAEVACVLSVSPPSALVSSTAWSFREEGTPGRLVTAGPQQSSSREWKGPMVIGGTVRVQATVNGSPLTDTARVIIQPRHWPEAVPDATEHDTVCAERTNECPLKYPPELLRDLGQVWPRWAVSFPIEQITVGPNTGYTYIGGDQSPVTITRLQLFYNPVLNEPGHAFWRSGTTCTQEALRNWVLSHERVHVQQFKKIIAEGIANGWFEGLVFFESAEATRARIPQWRTDLRAVLIQGGQAHYPRELFPPPPCDVLLPSSQS